MLRGLCKAETCRGMWLHALFTMALQLVIRGHLYDGVRICGYFEPASPFVQILAKEACPVNSDAIPMAHIHVIKVSVKQEHS